MTRLNISSIVGTIFTIGVINTTGNLYVSAQDGTERRAEDEYAAHNEMIARVKKARSQQVDRSSSHDEGAAARSFLERVKEKHSQPIGGSSSHDEGAAGDSIVERLKKTRIGNNSRDSNANNNAPQKVEEG